MIMASSVEPERLTVWTQDPPIRIPGSRRLFAAAQAHIDHIQAGALPDDMKLRAGFDVILQLGVDLDRMYRHQRLHAERLGSGCLTGA